MNFEENFWCLVKDRGRVANFYRNECEALWNNYSPDQQQAICESIEKKLQSGRFVSYRPNEALLDNVPRTPKPQPIFLRGDEGGDIVQVRYNGAYKLCSRATMELFGLEWVRNW